MKKRDLILIACALLCALSVWLGMRFSASLFMEEQYESAYSQLKEKESQTQPETETGVQSERRAQPETETFSQQEKQTQFGAETDSQQKEQKKPGTEADPEAEAQTEVTNDEVASADSLKAGHDPDPLGYACITADGELYGMYGLSEDQDIPIGKTNVLTIKDGEAYMTYADCPDQLCTRMGPVNGPFDMIVCLPNAVIIEYVKGEEPQASSDQPEIDGIS